MLTGASKKALRDWNDPVIVPLEEETGVEQNEHADHVVEWFETSSRRLSDQERLAIRLRFWEDLTAAEIGSILKIQPLRKVYTLLENSLKKLQHDARREFAQ
jgi:DNA-directed RNA polymerase specialized sigma24 family protein